MEDNGFQIQLGHGSKKRTNVIAYLRFICICGDNEGLDKISQCASGGRHEKGGDCRVCQCRKIFSDEERFTKAYDDMWPMRDSIVLRELTEKLEAIEIAEHQFALTKRRRERFIMSDSDKDVIVRSKLLKLRPGTNTFLNLPRHLCPDGGLPAMVGPDVMHTCKGGMIKYLLEWNMEICYTLEIIYANDDNMSCIVSRLDSMMKVFPIKQADTPFKLIHMSKGISTFQPEARLNKKSGAGAGGLMTGNIRMDDLPGILWQMTYCLDHLLPNTLCAGYILVNKALHNIRQIVYNACHGALDVIAILACRESYNDEDLKRTHAAIASINAHLFLVYTLRNDLKYAAKKTPVKERPAMLCIVRKFHIMMHIHSFGTSWGILKSGMQSVESMH